jgi:16S rRNA (cytosine1402-N4)-methyltransferase
MRMSPGHTTVTAYDVINNAPEKQLADIFYTLGGESSSRKVARFIVTEREQTPIVSTAQLAAIVMKVIPRYSRTVHPATKVFQALRIFVNDELNNIKAFLSQSIDLLNPEGRMVCISFHSGEDRLVKQFFKHHTESLSILTRKVVIASPEEVRCNPSARSAKLRAAELKNPL